MKVTDAAKRKNISRAAVVFASSQDKIDMVRIGGTPHVINNDKFKNWTPKGKKDGSNTNRRSNQAQKL